MSVHEFAKEMTEKEANNVIAYWELENKTKLDKYHALVRLGDSKCLAVATVMIEENKDSEIYEYAYQS